MAFLEKNRKWLALAATALLVIAALLDSVMVLGDFFKFVDEEIMRALDDGLDTDKVLYLAEELLYFVHRAVLGFWPMVFALLALLYAISEKNGRLFAIGAGITLVRMLLDVVLLTLVNTNLLTELFEGGLIPALSSLFYALPGNLMPHLLFGIVLVFSLKKTRGPVAAVAVAVLSGSLMINYAFVGGRGVVIDFCSMIGWEAEFGQIVESVLSGIGNVLANTLYYGGLFLVLPLTVLGKKSALEATTDYQIIRKKEL